MTLSLGPATSIGIGSGRVYRVGDAAVVVSGNRIAAINDDGEVFAARDYADASGLGLGNLLPYHVHDNRDGTLNVYYQVRDGDPLPIETTNWVRTLDAQTGDPTGQATELTTGPLALTNQAMLEHAVSLPDGSIAVLNANVTSTGMQLHIVNPDGSQISESPEFATGSSLATFALQFHYDVAVAGDKLLVTWTDTFGGSAKSVKAQLVNQNGTLSGAEFTISDAESAGFGNPGAVLAETLSNGKIAVVWVDGGTQPEDTDATSVWFKILNPDGSVAVDSTLVNTEVTAARQDTPLLFATEDGFAVGYSVLDFAGIQEGRLKSYDANGVLQDSLENAYAFGADDAIRTDNNTALIFDGEANELILPGNDSPLDTGGTGGGGSGKTLTGTKMRDVLIGGKKDDVLLGRGGKDRLEGRGGDDRLDGGRGADKLKGGKGADEFVFAKKYGKDTIKDFKDNVDTILIDDALYTGFFGVRKVINKFASVVGDDIVFDFGKNELKIEDFTNLNALRNDIEII